MTALADELYQMPVQQLYGGAWYFQNNAEIKGYNCLYAALSWVNKIVKDLRETLPKDLRETLPKDLRK